MQFQTRRGGSQALMINVTSLIDVLFVLLLFLVVSTTFKDRTAVNLTLPRSTSVDAAPEGPAVVVSDGRRGDLPERPAAPAGGVAAGAASAAGRHGGGPAGPAGRRAQPARRRGAADRRRARQRIHQGQPLGAARREDGGAPVSTCPARKASLSMAMNGDRPTGCGRVAALLLAAGLALGLAGGCTGDAPGPLGADLPQVPGFDTLLVPLTIDSLETCRRFAVVDTVHPFPRQQVLYVGKQGSERSSILVRYDFSVFQEAGWDTVDFTIDNIRSVKLRLQGLKYYVVPAAPERRGRRADEAARRQRAGRSRSIRRSTRDPSRRSGRSSVPSRRGVVRRSSCRCPGPPSWPGSSPAVTPDSGSPRGIRPGRRRGSWAMPARN